MGRLCNRRLAELYNTTLDELCRVPTYNIMIIVCGDEHTLAMASNAKEKAKTYEFLDERKRCAYLACTLILEINVSSKNGQVM